MSLYALTSIWRDPPCKGGDLLCLLAIADNADDNGFAWPSVPTIARKAAMGERGAQKCIKKLAEAGLIIINYGGGRNKTNTYQITTNGVGDTGAHQNPERNTPPAGSPFTDVNPEQSDINPEPAFAKPRTPVHPNSHEPPMELPISKSTKVSDPVFDALSRWASSTAVASFISYRKKHKSKGLTETAAKRLAGSLEEIANGGGDPSDALGMAEEKGWATVQPDWYFNSKQGGQHVGSTNPNSPRNDPTLRAIANAAGSF